MAGTKRYVGSENPREKQAKWLYGERVKVQATHVIDKACELVGAGIREALQPVQPLLPVNAAAETWCDSHLVELGVRDGGFVLLSPAAHGTRPQRSAAQLKTNAPTNWPM